MDGSTAGGEETYDFIVPEMDCPTCTDRVSNSIKHVDREAKCSINTSRRSVKVTPSGDTPRENFRQAIENAGYMVSGETELHGDPMAIFREGYAYRIYIGAVLVGAALVLIATNMDPLILQIESISIHPSTLLYLAGIFIAASEVFHNAYYSLKTLTLDIHLLMTVAIIGASLLGEFVEAALLAVLFGVAELLEEYSMENARKSLGELMELSPDTANRVLDTEDGTQEVHVTDLRVGDIVLVHPGEKIPVDGKVTSGESSVDESPITGESKPRYISSNDEVYAGTYNKSGYLEVEVTKPSEENTLSKIIDLVEESERERTEKQRFVDKFASYYTPIVVGFAVLTAVIPPLALGYNWETWIIRGLTLLVISCPCALVISTPVSVVSGISSAARNGVLIKNGVHLETLKDIDTVVFDKTGTLTTGELSVNEVVPLGERTREEVLSSAASLESRSKHPIAEAITAEAPRNNDADRQVTEFVSMASKGVRADIDGVPHYAGSPSFISEMGHDMSSMVKISGEGETMLSDIVDEMSMEGNTVVIVATDEEIEGLIAVNDALRPEAFGVIERIREIGIERVVMLTGDNELAARSVAEELGFDEYRYGLLPDEKVDSVDELRSIHGSVAVIGDGVNDAPALARADVGIAMAAIGSDTAIETSDVALLSDDLTRLPYLFLLSRKANSVIRGNIWGSLAVKLVLALGVPFGYVSLIVAVLVGDMGMTLVVTGNSMRLLRLKP